MAGEVVLDTVPVPWAFRIDMVEAGDTKGVLRVDMYAYTGLDKVWVTVVDPEFPIPPVDDYWEDTFATMIEDQWFAAGWDIP